MMQESTSTTVVNIFLYLFVPDLWNVSFAQAAALAADPGRVESDCAGGTLF